LAATAARILLLDNTTYRWREEIMSTTTTPDLSAVKARQQKTWASGDFAVVAGRIVIVSENLADAADLRAGSRVLDIACGNGNAALAAARSGAHAVGVDYVPALLENGRARAVAEGFDVEFRLGDAENLPAPDHSFDATLSVFGTMFAPDHQRTANEVIRVTRPGGTVGLVSWTPDGFIGQLFRTVGKHVPPPAIQSPLLWGTEDHLAGLFKGAIADIRSAERHYTWRFPSAEELIGFLRRWYGPTVKAYEAVGDDGRPALENDLVELARRWNTRREGDGLTIPAAYLETVIHLK
jgi:ubiquinone/menaquinone biosynthesis C-methylase UbiE